ncbi:hypothetical protein VQ042_11760 [Aurantimonas sp. A2-1-M11]
MEDTANDLAETRTHRDAETTKGPATHEGQPGRRVSNWNPAVATLQTA